jgi:hypothetical protein
MKQKVAMFKSGKQFTIAVDISGNLHSWGKNLNGELGIASQQLNTIVSRSISNPSALDVTQLSGAENATIALSACSSNNPYSVDCICQNIDEFIVRKNNFACQTPGCAVNAQISFDNDVSSVSALVNLQLTDFSSPDKYVTANNSYFTLPYFINKTNNCSQYQTLINSSINANELATGFVELTLQSSPNVQQSCSSNVVNTLIELQTLPCYSAPDFWFTGEDFTEYVLNTPLNVVGISQTPGIKGKALRFRHKYSRIEFLSGNKIKNQGLTISFWARFTDLTDQTIFSYHGLTNDTIQYAVTYESGLSFYVLGKKYTSSISVPDSNFHHYTVKLEPNGNVKFFQDGALKFNQITSASNPNIILNGRVALGQFYETTLTFKDNFAFNGDLDDVKIYGKVIPDSLINIYAQQMDSTSVWKSENNADDDLGLNHGSTFGITYESNKWVFGGSLDQYILIDNVAHTRFPSTELSVSFNFMTSQNGSIFSYGIPTELEVFSFGISGGIFVFKIFGVSYNTGTPNYATSASSFIAITWKSATGELTIYGNLHFPIYSQTGIAKTKVIPKGGSWVFGQKHKNFLGRFDNSSTYNGNISNFYLFNKVKLYGRCGPKPESDPTVCSSHGNCAGTSCYCDYGYTSDTCGTQIQCFGKNAFDPTVCSSKGTCINGVCSCIPGYYGSDCSKKNDIYTILKTMCTSNCSLDLNFWYNCFLYDGPSCFCGYNKNNIVINCNSDNEITGLYF